MTDTQPPSKVLSIEDEARKHCDWLLNSAAARGSKHAESLVILAFTVGAAWGLNRPDMIELARAQAESSRSL